MRSTASLAAVASREQAAAALAVACEAFPSTTPGRALARAFPPVRDHRFDGLLHLIDGLKP